MDPDTGYDGEIDREMMALDAPAPWVVLPWFSEDSDKIFLRIAADRIVFDLGQDLFQAHDGGCLDQTFLAESTCQQGHCQRTLFRTEIAERNAAALHRNIVPVFP